MKPSEILRKAKALIDTPEKWTQKVYARDSNDNDVSYAANSACKFCSLGALHRTSDNLYLAMDYLGKRFGTFIDNYNDTHTHAEVMAKWDEAIALAEADERGGV